MICIRAVLVEYLVAIHYCYQILTIAQVDYVMGIAGKHVHCLHAFTAYLVVPYFIRAFTPQLNESMPAYHYERFPLAVMPVLPLGDPGFGDVDAELPAACCFEKLGKAAALIDIHFQRIFEFVCRQVAQIERIQPHAKPYQYKHQHRFPDP